MSSLQKSQNQLPDQQHMFSKRTNIYEHNLSGCIFMFRGMYCALNRLLYWLDPYYVTNTIGSTSIRHRFDAKMLDRCSSESYCHLGYGLSTSRKGLISVCWFYLRKNKQGRCVRCWWRRRKPVHQKKSLCPWTGPSYRVSSACAARELASCG